MSVNAPSAAGEGEQIQPPMTWLPVVVIALAQILVAANTSSLSVSIGAIVGDFGIAAPSVQTAVVCYALVTAAFMLLGGRLGAVVGAKRAFLGAILLFALAMAGVALSTGRGMLIGAEITAGLAAAVIVPSLVGLIGANYSGSQQSFAIGILGAAAGIGGSLAILVAGGIGTVASWRMAFWLIAGLALVVAALGLKVTAAPQRAGVVIDWVGVALWASAVILFTLGLNFAGQWGLVRARPAAPTAALGVSPTLIMLIAGLLLAWGFVVWQHRRIAAGRTPLLSPEVLDARVERRAALSLLIMAALGGGVSFLLPLYMQIVQGYSGIATAIGLVPYALAVFVAALLVTRLLATVGVRWLARGSFLLMAAGLALDGAAIHNTWGTPVVALGLVLVGLGQGALMTVLSSVLVSASPRELAGEVGGLRGTVSSLGGAIGAAATGVIVVALLALAVANAVASQPALPDELMAHFELSSVTFVSNDRLAAVLDEAGALPEPAAAVLELNEAARLQALRLTFFALAAVALLGLIPTGGLATRSKKAG